MLTTICFYVVEIELMDFSFVDLFALTIWKSLYIFVEIFNVFRLELSR